MDVLVELDLLVVLNVRARDDAPDSHVVSVVVLVGEWNGVELDGMVWNKMK